MLKLGPQASAGAGRRRCEGEEAGSRRRRANEGALLHTNPPWRAGVGPGASPTAGVLRSSRETSGPVRRGCARGIPFVMPELPEVEHAARTLRAWLGGRTIRRAKAADNDVSSVGGFRANFERLLPGTPPRADRSPREIPAPHRSTAASDCSATGHDGQVGFAAAPSPVSGRRTVPRHSHARLELDDGSALHYVDPRLFGQLTLVRGGAVSELPVIRASARRAPGGGRRGPPPRVLAGALGPSRWLCSIRASSAGVGNIYADRGALSRGNSPLRPSRSLTLEDVSRLAEGNPGRPRGWPSPGWG